MQAPPVSVRNQTTRQFCRLALIVVLTILSIASVVAPASAEPAYRGPADPSFDEPAVESPELALVRGDEDKAAVRHVQRRLRHHAYDSLKVDGDFGKKTERAVRHIQYRYGLRVDGNVGPKTLAMLNGGVIYLKEGVSEGLGVRRFQKRLATVTGWDVDADGDFGPNTKEAVMDYQRRVDVDGDGKGGDLIVDGVVGRSTYNAVYQGKPLGEVDPGCLYHNNSTACGLREFGELYNTCMRNIRTPVCSIRGVDALPGWPILHGLDVSPGDIYVLAAKACNNEASASCPMMTTFANYVHEHQDILAGVIVLDAALRILIPGSDCIALGLRLLSEFVEADAADYADCALDLATSLVGL